MLAAEGRGNGEGLLNLAGFLWGDENVQKRLSGGCTAL